MSRLKWITVALALALGFSACTSSASGGPAEPSPAVPAGANSSTDSDGGAEAKDPVDQLDVPVVTTSVPTTSAPASAVSNDDSSIPTGVTNDGVLAAAVIIVSNGDLEAAIAEGLVTEAEAEAALVALETGTLDRYTG